MDEEISKCFDLDGIVTLVDAKHVVQHLDEEKPEGRAPCRSANVTRVARGCFAS